MSLLALPDHILSLTAYHLALLTPPYSPPSTLIPLLATCRTLYSRLSLDNNPSLYAALFHVEFDGAAVERRVGKVSAIRLAMEYRKRIQVVKRLRSCVLLGNAGLEERDLWTIYLMILENDGKNILHLTQRLSNDNTSLPTTQSLIQAYISLYHSAILLPSSTASGYPVDNEMRALMFWIDWLLVDQESIERESKSRVEELLFILRPYVFASKQYEITYGPWTLPVLPTTLHPPCSAQHRMTQLGLSPTEQSQISSYITDQTPHSRKTVIEYYGKQVDMCGLISSQAAILGFFGRVDSSGMGGMGGGVLERQVLRGWVGEDNQLVLHRPRRSNRPPIISTITSSHNHDQDFRRLSSCWDASSSPGMSLADWKGTFEGCWEGNFSFVDFDMYRSMLSGDWRSLYHAEFGEQSQVWKMEEVFVRRTRRRPTLEINGNPAPTMESSTSTTSSSNLGSALNAGFPITSTSFDNIPEDYRAGRRGSSSAAAAVAHMLSGEGRDAGIRAVLDVGDGDVLSSEAVDELIALGGKELEDVELLLVGTGHSAWGEFVLRGRIRIWDGMITLVKEYSPDGRGRWLYRGYIVTGRTLVGRWRDTFTPQDYVGYEGTFVLTRRG